MNTDEHGFLAVLGWDGRWSGAARETVKTVEEPVDAGTPRFSEVLMRVLRIVWVGNVLGNVV